MYASWLRYQCFPASHGSTRRPGSSRGRAKAVKQRPVIEGSAAANVALIVDRTRLRRRGEHKSFWLWVVVPVIGIAVLAIPVWGDLRPGQPSPYNSLPWLTLALIAAGFVYQLVLGAVRPAALRMAPALLEGEENQATEENSVPTAG
jgi:hypothetical protein